MILAVLDGTLEIGALAHRILEGRLGLLNLLIGLGQLAIELPHAAIELGAVRLKFAKTVQRDRPVEIRLVWNCDLDAARPRQFDEIEATWLLVVIFLGRRHVDAPEAYLLRLPRNGQRHHVSKARGEEVPAIESQHLLDRIRHRRGELGVMTHHVKWTRHFLHPLDISRIESMVFRVERMQLEERLEPLQDAIRAR